MDVEWSFLPPFCVVVLYWVLVKHIISSSLTFVFRSLLNHVLSQLLLLLKFTLWSLVHKLLLVRRRDLVLEWLLKPLTIVCVEVIIGSLRHYGILDVLCWTIDRLMSLRHQTWKLSTHSLLRSFVHIVLLFLVLKHALCRQFARIISLRLHNIDLISRLSHPWGSRTRSLKPISNYLLLQLLVRLVNNSTLINLNDSSGFLEWTWLTCLLRRRSVIDSISTKKSTFSCFVKVISFSLIIQTVLENGLVPSWLFAAVKTLNLLFLVKVWFIFQTVLLA